MINCVTGGAIINTKSISRPFEICESVASAADVIVYNNLLSASIKGGCNWRRGGDGEGMGWPVKLTLSRNGLTCQCKVLSVHLPVIYRSIQL